MGGICRGVEICDFGGKKRCAFMRRRRTRLSSIGQVAAAMRRNKILSIPKNSPQNGFAKTATLRQRDSSKTTPPVRHGESRGNSVAERCNGMEGFAGVKKNK